MKSSHTTSQWSNAFKLVCRAPHCVQHWELTQKVSFCWYFTPYGLAQIYSSHSSLCWRGCGQIGNIFYIFWSCKNIASFWIKIFTIILDVTGIVTSPSPALAVLSLEIDNIPCSFCKVVTYILVTARPMIARHEKPRTFPTL